MHITGKEKTRDARRAPADCRWMALAGGRTDSSAKSDVSCMINISPAAYLASECIVHRRRTHSLIKLSHFIRIDHAPLRAVIKKIGKWLLDWK